MLIDASKIIECNKELLQASSWAMENVALANAAIDVLRSSCDLKLPTDDHVTMLRLAIRLINSAGAGGDAFGERVLPAGCGSDTRPHRSGFPDRFVSTAAAKDTGMADQ
ncbi:MAG: hypothetical protein E5X41_30585 [Mesorhizobium sp.]|nr:MAG: hypothetical protein E5X41_30585 [Mesorhizobium sp.]